MKLKLVSIIACVILTVVNSKDNFSFTLPARDKLCLYEYFSDNTLVTYDIKPSNKESNRIIVRDNSNRSIIHKDNTDHLKESFTTYAGGYYEVCIMNTDSSEQTFEFDQKSGIAAKDYSQVPKVKDLKPIEQDLQKLNDQADEYWHLVNYANSHEKKYEALRENVISNITIFTIVLISLMIMIGGVEVVLAKQIIMSKKLK